MRWDIKFEPNIDLNNPEVRDSVVRIDANRIAIQSFPLPPALRSKFDRLNIIRAVRGTTAIEGNPLTEEDIKGLIETIPEKREKSKFDTEVINAWKLYQHIKRIGKEGGSNVIPEDLINEIHKILTVNCDYKHNIPGKYRNHNVTAGTYRAPDHSKVRELMADFISFINSEKVLKTYNPIIRAIVAHFYLISIHPFADGNGRSSRGIEAYVLYKGGYNIVGFYSLANFYYLNRDEYVNQLQDARFKYNGNLTNFVIFSLKGYLKEMEKIRDEFVDFYYKLTYRDYIEELLRLDKINDRIYNFLYNLCLSKIKISEIEFKNRRHPLVNSIFGDISERTFYRDLEIINEFELIQINNGLVITNHEVMNKFLPE